MTAANRKSQIRKRFEAILDCAVQQEALLKQEHFGDDQSLKAFQELLERRQRLSQEIGELSQSEALDPELRPLLQRIKQSDQQNQERMHACFSGVRCDIQKLKTGRHSRQAYTGRGPSAEGAFVDRKK